MAAAVEAGLGFNPAAAAARRGGAGADGAREGAG
jgi:hypothetical protein